MRHVPQVNWKNWWTAYRQIKLNTPLSSTLSLGYLADFTKAIKNPMDYKCLLDESYKM